MWHGISISDVGLGLVCSVFLIGIVFGGDDDEDDAHFILYFYPFPLLILFDDDNDELQKRLPMPLFYFGMSDWFAKGLKMFLGKCRK